MALEYIRAHETQKAQETEHPLTARHLAQAAFEMGEMKLAEPTNVNPFEDIKQTLNNKIVGQPEAVDSLMLGLMREKTHDPNRPIVTLLFTGPTGVGKTEMAKELARLLHNGDESAFLKIDCTQFSEGSNISALVGAAPEYVGREQKPMFDPKIIERERSVVLFDEVEKGHRKLHDLMMQIMEEGEITLLNGGNTVSFRNSIIILTSNVGSSEIMEATNQDKIGFNTSNSEPNIVSKKRINDVSFSALSRIFRPEFLNRIDQRVVFSSLSDDQLGEALDRYVDAMGDWPQYQEANIQLVLSQDVINEVVRQSPERAKLGARHVNRNFDKTVGHEFIQSMSKGSIKNNSLVYAVLDNDASNTAKIPTKFYTKTIPPRPKVIADDIAKEDDQVVTESAVYSPKPVTDSE